MGEEQGRSPRWRPLLAVLVVLVMGLGVYRLVWGPSTSAAPEQAEAAEQPLPVLSEGGRSLGGDASAAHPTSVRLGGHTVTLRGPGVQQAHRETSALSLGRLRNGWLVRLTSKSCEGQGATQVSYGVARASGRFNQWDSSITARQPTWRSPDRALVVTEDGGKVIVRRTANGKVVTVKAAGL